MSKKQPWEIELDKYEREQFPAKRTAPQITFSRNQSPVRPWTCNIVLPDDEYHGGEGTTQCEALMLACINWAMHGTTK